MSDLKGIFVYHQHGLVGCASQSTRSNQLANLLSKSLGSLRADRQRQNIYYVEEGCAQVRKTMHVDQFYLHNELQPDTLFQQHVSPLIEKTFQSNEDALVVLGGYEGTFDQRQDLLFGSTLREPLQVNVAADSSFRFVPSEKSSWGLIHLAVNDILERSAQRSFNVSITSVKIQLDNLVDALISPTALKVRFGDADSGGRVRQQYLKLLALTSASTLDVEQDQGYMRITDQTVCPLKSMEDFSHVIHCLSSSPNNAAKILQMMSSGSSRGSNGKGSAPPHSLTTVRIAPAHVSSTTVAGGVAGNASDEIRNIHFLELSDFDQDNMSAQDQEEYNHSIRATMSLLTALAKKSEIEVDSVYRSSTLTHLLCSLMKPLSTNVVVFGYTSFNTAPALMKTLSMVTLTPIRTVLHGPDLEGEVEVDPELRHHLEHVQQECEGLQKEIRDMESAKNVLNFRMQQVDEKLVRVEQRQSTMRRLTVTSNRLSFRGPSGGESPEQKSPNFFQCTPQESRSPVGEHCGTFPTKPWDSNSPQFRSHNLEMDLRDKTTAFAEAMRTAELQIDMLTKEQQRMTAKAVLLQGEHDKLKEALRSRTAAFQQQREAMKKEYAQRVAKLLESRRSAADKKSQEQRQQAALDADRSQTRAAEFKKQQEVDAQKLKESMEIWVAEDTVRKSEQAELQRESRRLQDQLCSLHCEQQATIHDRHTGRTQHQRTIKQLEQAASVLNDFAFRMSSLLSSIEKRMHYEGMLRVTVHEPMLREPADVIAQRTSKARRWLRTATLDPVVQTPLVGRKASLFRSTIDSQCNTSSRPASLEPFFFRLGSDHDDQLAMEESLTAGSPLIGRHARTTNQQTPTSTMEERSASAMLTSDPPLRELLSKGRPGSASSSSPFSDTQRKTEAQLRDELTTYAQRSAVRQHVVAASHARLEVLQKDARGRQQREHRCLHQQSLQKIAEERQQGGRLCDCCRIERSTSPNRVFSN